MNASKETVWKTLMDFENYASWNPFIVSIKGKPILDSQLINTMVNNGKETVFKPVVTRVEVNQNFEWLGQALMGMFKGRHYFILEDIGHGQTKLIHGEKFSGLLSGIIMSMIGKDTQQNFENMNTALKKRVEQG